MKPEDEQAVSQGDAKDIDELSRSSDDDEVDCRPVRTFAYQVLRQHILSIVDPDSKRFVGEVPSPVGRTKLYHQIRQQLSKDEDFSDASLRQALIMIEASGLGMIKDSRGQIIVQRPGAKIAESIFEIRKHLEVEIALFIAKSPRKAELATKVREVQDQL